LANVVGLFRCLKPFALLQAFLAKKEKFPVEVRNNRNLPPASGANNVIFVFHSINPHNEIYCCQRFLWLAVRRLPHNPERRT
jgi:hypothetical protein